MISHHTRAHATGKLAVCDFGLARKFSDPIEPYTLTIVTLYYRAPELMLGARTYSTEIDMWSVGCIFAEMITGDILFPGSGEIDQLQKIFAVRVSYCWVSLPCAWGNNANQQTHVVWWWLQTIGIPTEENWPTYADLPQSKVVACACETPCKRGSSNPCASSVSGVSVSDYSLFCALPCCAADLQMEEHEHQV